MGWKTIGGTRDYARPERKPKSNYEKIPGGLIRDEPELVDACLNCTREDCPGTCNEVALARDRARLENERAKAMRTARGKEKKYPFRGGKYTVLELAVMIGMRAETVRQQLRRGLTPEEVAAAHARRSNSLAAAAREHGLCEETVQHRVRKQGMTLEEALAKPVRPKHKGDNLAQMAREHGVSVEALRYRVDVKKLTPQDALEALIAERENGRNVNIVQIAREHGINPETLRYRVNVKGMTLEEALAEPVRHCRPNGGISQIAREHGISPNTLWARIRYQGLTLEEALEKPTQKKGAEIARLAREHGIRPETVKYRMHTKGMTLEEALAEPVRRKAGRKEE